jgi:hypothetical protein
LFGATIGLSVVLLEDSSTYCLVDSLGLLTAGCLTGYKIADWLAECFVDSFVGWTMDGSAVLFAVYFDT